MNASFFEKNRKTKHIVIILVIVSMIAGSLALPAISEKHSVDAASKVKVKFIANGGKFADKADADKESIVLKKKKNKKIGKLPKVKKSNYVFKGWYTKKKAEKNIPPKRR